MINPRDPDFTCTPADERRPEYGYAPSTTQAPLISVITPYYNVGAVFQETVRCLRRMSLPYWEWLIVDDGSTDEQSLAQLEQLTRDEPRMRVLRQANGGPAVARNTAVREARGRYLLQLDGDDLVEPTFVEKALWLLETRPQFAACTGYNVTFGLKPLLWPYGFQQYAESYDDNKNTSQAVIRRDEWLAVGGNDESISYEHADWDFWLTLADAGKWGYTIPEYLTWYRTQARSLMVEIEADRERNYRFRRWLHAKHQGLRSRFPHPEWKQNATPISGPVPEQAPFANALAKPAGVKRVLLVAPWMEMGGADKVNLDMLRLLGREGYQFTVATTTPSADPWMHRFAALTPDVFALHRFLDCADYPRFLAYLIESRQIDVVLISNSEPGYALVPYLRVRFPHLTLVDYNHLEEEQWLDGGYPALSLRMRDALDARMTCTEHLRSWMVRRGADPERVAVCYCGVDTAQWSAEGTDRQRLRQQFGVSSDEPVIAFVGRLVEQKRPTLFVQILQRLAARGARFVALVAGSGPDAGSMRRRVSRAGLRQRVRFLGALDDAGVRELLAASDVICLPSNREGLALVLYEAMAMGVVPVTAAVGGQGELVMPECGYAIPPGEGELEAYVEALAELLADPERRHQMAERARRRVRESFDSAQFAASLRATLLAAERRAHARAATGDDAEPAAKVLERLSTDLERLRRQQVAEAQALGDGGTTLASRARWLRQRYIPLGSERYEQYKRARRGVMRGIRLAASVPRYVRGGGLRAGARALWAYMLAPPEDVIAAPPIAPTARTARDESLPSRVAASGDSNEPARRR